MELSTLDQVALAICYLSVGFLAASSYATSTYFKSSDDWFPSYSVEWLEFLFLFFAWPLVILGCALVAIAIALGIAVTAGVRYFRGRLS